MSKQIKVYNEEGTLVAVDMETILELLELNGYKVVEQKESNEWTKQDTYSIKKRTKVG